MLTIAMYLFSFFLMGSDQADLITKISQEDWDKTPVRSKQELLQQAKIIKMQQKEIEEYKNLSEALRYVLKPNCRNDLK